MPDIVVPEASRETDPPKEEKTEDIFEKIEPKEKIKKEEKVPDYKTDNQLNRAVDILKAIRIYKEIKY
jgi:hypothetical protein